MPTLHTLRRLSSANKSREFTAPPQVTWEASFPKAFGAGFSAPARSANYKYSRHCREVPCTLPLYSVKFCNPLRLEYRNKMPQLVFDIAGCRHGMGNFLSQ